MARLRSLLVILALLSPWPGQLPAAESDLEVVEGLRKRENFEQALKHLDAADARPDLPADVKAVIPLEKATTLIQWAKTQSNPEAANVSLERAQILLEQFVKANPEHPQAARADSDMANILVGKGKTAILQANSTGNGQKRSDFLKQATENFDRARQHFQAAAKQYDKEWQSYGPFVDAQKDPGKYEAKVLAERMKVRAELDLAILQFEAIRVHDKDDPRYQQGLRKASEAFELLHQRHRSQVAGLYARLYQAKCFEEQGDLQKALGLYNELLSRDTESTTMKNLQAQVTQFKLICLNADPQGEWRKVERIAQEWIAANPTLLDTRYGVGIRFEQARALEKLGTASKLDENEKRTTLEQALNLARVVNRAGGEYRDVSRGMISRLAAVLADPGANTNDFDTVYGTARELVNRVKSVKDAVKAAQSPEETAVRKREFESHLDKAEQALTLAISLCKPNTRIKEVNVCKYSLCFVYYEQRRSHESGELGESIARSFADDREHDLGSIPSDAAYLAMAAYAQAYNLKGNQNRQADIQKVISIAEFIVAKWPGTSKAIDAQVMLGQMYVQIKEFLKAVEVLEKIPADSGMYWRAQLILGQALWEATVVGMSKPEAEQPPAAKLAEYRARAQDVLKKALDWLEPKLGENEPLPEELASAKLTLAQIANQTGKFEEALQLLETDKRSVLSAIKLKEGEQRPTVGVKSEKFVEEVQKQLLQARLGLKNLGNDNTDQK